MTTVHPMERDPMLDEPEHNLDLADSTQDKNENSEAEAKKIDPFELMREIAVASRLEYARANTFYDSPEIIRHRGVIDNQTASPEERHNAWLLLEDLQKQRNQINANLPPIEVGHIGRLTAFIEHKQLYALDLARAASAEEMDTVQFDLFGLRLLLQADAVEGLLQIQESVEAPKLHISTLHPSLLEHKNYENPFVHMVINEPMGSIVFKDGDYVELARRREFAVDLGALATDSLALTAQVVKVLRPQVYTKTPWNAQFMPLPEQAGVLSGRPERELAEGLIELANNNAAVMQLLYANDYAYRLKPEVQPFATNKDLDGFTHLQEARQFYQKHQGSPTAPYPTPQSVL